MTDKLNDAMAEVRRVTRAADPWTGDDFTCAQPEHDPAPIDDAIATILNAVASGDLITRDQHLAALGAVIDSVACEVARWSIAASEEIEKLAPDATAALTGALLREIVEWVRK